MTFTDPTSEYPASKLQDKDIGIQSNRQSFRLDGDISSSDSNLQLQEDTSNLASQGIVTIGVERIKYTSKNDSNNELQSLTRGFDGSSAASHSDGAPVNANIVAFHHNKMLEEVKALQDELGTAGSSTTLDRNIELHPSTSSGQYPLTLGTLSGHSDPEPFLKFERSTDGGGTYSEVGTIDYDPSNSELELNNLTLAAGSSTNILVEDDNLLHLGTDEDTSYVHDSGDGRTEVRTSVAIRWEDSNANELVSLETGGDFTVPNRVRVGSSGTPTDPLDVDGTSNFSDALTLQDITDPSHAEGQLWYSTDTNTLSFHNDRSDVTLQIGEENYVRAFNNTGSTISNGDAVYISGFDSNSGLAEIALAKADSDTTADLIGIATEAIADGGTGMVTTYGLVRNVDTSSFTAGDTVYLSANTAGALTSTEPSAPDFSVEVGNVARSGSASGQIFVAPSDRRANIYAQGSVPFADSNGKLIEDNSNLSWDDANNDLTVQNLTVPTDATISGGGDLILAQSTANYTVQWNDPGAARTYTIPDTGVDDTFLFESRTLTGGNAIDAIGDLSADRTIAVSSNSIQTDELDLSIAPTWTGDHDFDGAVTRVVNNITGDGSATTISNSDHLVVVDSSSNTETINLPSSPTDGEEHTVKRNGSNDVTVDGNGNNIDGSATTTLVNDNDAITVIWSNSITEWQVV